MKDFHDVKVGTLFRTHATFPFESTEDIGLVVAPCGDIIAVISKEVDQFFELNGARLILFSFRTGRTFAEWTTGSFPFDLLYEP